MSSPLDRVRIVLDQPQNLVNVAAVIRAMKNMGLHDLALVDPGEPFDPYRVTGIAHRADDVAESTRVVSTLAEALGDATFVVGTTARHRTAQRNYAPPREIAPAILREAGRGQVAILFGREDRGLSNEALDRCHAAVIIPTVPDYSSLNLAQACLVIAYELFVLAHGSDQDLPVGRRSQGPATQADMEDTYQALEQGLHTIDFFKAREPERVLRTFRTLLGRAVPDLHEARLVRAVGYEISNYIRRNLPPGE